MMHSGAHYYGRKSKSLFLVEETKRKVTMMRAVPFVLILSSNALAFTTGPSPTSRSSSIHMTLTLSDENDTTTNDSTDSAVSPPRRPQVVMSKSIPFLRCPAPLVDCEFAGNVGFDPLGLAKTSEQLWEYREAEIKHARLAMLAAIGWPASELWDRAIASQMDMEPILDPEGRVPSLLNGGLQRVSPIWWGFCIGLTAAIDLYGIAKSRQGETTYEPGKLGFDPLGFYPVDPKGQKKVEEAEIRNGRLAMLAVVFYCWEEWLTKIAVVTETPWLFMPINESIEMIEESMAAEVSLMFASFNM